MFPGGGRPLLVRIIGKELALIKAYRRFQVHLCPRGFCTREVLMGRLQPLLESLNIKPDFKCRIDKVSVVPMDHYSRVRFSGAQRLTKPVDCYVQAVAGSVEG